MESPHLVELFAPCTSRMDPRRSNARHLLFDIFVMALCGVMSGAEGWEDIADDGHAQAQWRCATKVAVHWCRLMA